MEKNHVDAAAIRRRLGSCADLNIHPLQLGDTSATAFFMDGLVSIVQISEQVIKPAMENLTTGTAEEKFARMLTGGIYNAVTKEAMGEDAAVMALLNGFCLITVDCIGRAVMCETKTGEKRAPAPPQVESTVKGAKDAFTETSRTNTSLVRRHLRSDMLQVEEFVVGKNSGSNVSFLYLQGAADQWVVSMVRQRLKSLQVDSMVSPAAVETALAGVRKTPFPMLQYTERTDKFCQGLLLGQVGVLVDGLPQGYLLPVDLGRFMTSQEDRGVDYITASAIRALRYFALICALFLPAFYVAMACFHPQMIPTRLLETIAQSKKNVPFPTAAEVLALLTAFEILQEAGLHLPRAIGQTVSIIGGLVVGSAAVEAGFISPAALIVVSVAGICGFAVPGKDFTDAIRVWRAVLSLCAAFLGLYGLTLGGLVLLSHLSSLTSCRRPYLHGEGVLFSPKRGQ